jgi:hypothetical protein
VVVPFIIHPLTIFFIAALGTSVDLEPIFDSYPFASGFFVNSSRFDFYPFASGFCLTRTLLTFIPLPQAAV